MARRLWVVVVIVGSLALTACSEQPSSGGSSPTTSVVDGAAGPTPTATPTVPPVRVVPAPADGATDVRPDQRVVVKAQGGPLTRVVVGGSDGSTVEGVLEAGVWTSTTHLAPGTRYTVKTRSTRQDGSVQSDTTTFETLSPAVTATYGILYDGRTVGVGAPASIQFDSPVATKEMRRTIERNVAVRTVPEVEGSWGWLDHRQLMWRPKSFWKPGTKVTVTANLRGLQTGPGKWVGDSSTASFTVGRSMISTVDIPGHTMTITQDGKVVRRIPVSAGKGDDPKFVTRSGTKVIIEKKGDMTMDSETVGIPKDDPDYYKVQTKDNLRVTWTGEFLHSAPWSVGSQGAVNVSHGCVNLAPDAASWLFDNSLVGDVIHFTGSKRPFLPTEGIGVWQYTYAQWQKQSALAR